MRATRDLRTPFFILALMVVFAAYALEIGSNWFLTPQQAASSQSVQGQLGIPSLWLIDSSLLWVLLLAALGLVIDKNALARWQGVVSLILSIVIILLGFKTLIVAFIELIIMIALLSSFFGWLIYLPLFAFFATDSAATVLGTITLFKLVAVALLILAQQQFLESKGLVFLILLSLICDVLLAFLHALPPGFLVSVTDAVGAIIISIVAIVYAVFQLVWAVIAIVRALTTHH